MTGVNDASESWEKLFACIMRSDQLFNGNNSGERSEQSW